MAPLGRPCQKPRPPEFAGLRGEGSTPVPLPPPPIFGAPISPSMDGPKIPSKLGHSIAATVLEIAEFRHFSLGDGIFLRSFVLCGFSIVSKSEVPQGQLETNFAPGSNPGWMSERN